MKFKPPKSRKKTTTNTVKMFGKMLKTPLFILFLLGTINCDEKSDTSEPAMTDIRAGNSNLTFTDHRHRHSRLKGDKKEVLSDIRYLRRHLNKEIVNFVMMDSLTDGEVEKRLHYDGVTGKETSVASDGKGLKLRQLTDGRHLVQIIYSQNGEIQDCEIITQRKSARDFLKTLRSELKTALDEMNINLLEKSNVDVDDKFYRSFRNITIKLLKNGESLPVDVSEWFDYEKLKRDCLIQHQEIKYMIENKNKVSETSLARSTRSIRENFIIPGTKWCGAGQLAETYNELGPDRAEDSCCRAHDNCHVNIGAFKRRFGYFNFRPYTISHCKCDRRFRACLKLADTSVSNMVGKLFFNVVQTKCFVLKPVKVCTKRSWWGKCLQRGYRKQAYLRGNLPY